MTWKEAKRKASHIQRKRERKYPSFVLLSLSIIMFFGKENTRFWCSVGGGDAHWLMSCCYCITSNHNHHWNLYTLVIRYYYHIVIQFQKNVSRICTTVKKCVKKVARVRRMDYSIELYLKLSTYFLRNNISSIQLKKQHKKTCYVYDRHTFVIFLTWTVG